MIVNASVMKGFAPISYNVPNSRHPQRSLATAGRSKISNRTSSAILGFPLRTGRPRCPDRITAHTSVPRVASATATEVETLKTGAEIETTQDNADQEIVISEAGRILSEQNGQLGVMELQKIDINHDAGWVGKTVGSLLDALQQQLMKGMVPPPDTPDLDFLKGVFGPNRNETFERELQVEGTVPPEMNGVYLRTGANPLLEPQAGYHWFDGDGMVHGARVKDGKIAYCNRYVETYRLQKERDAGHQMFVRIGDYRGSSGLVMLLAEQLKEKLGFLDLAQGKGTANTSVTYHAGRVMALQEGDLPYQVQVEPHGLLETVGRVKVGEWQSPFTAHPKVDPETGIMHIIGYEVDKKSQLQYGAIGPDGTLLTSVAVDLPYPTMMHDFVITENYAIFPHLPLCFEPEIMVKGEGLPFKFRKDFKSRFGILPLCAKDVSELRWLEFDVPFMVFHFANAWEDGNKIKIFGCHMSDFTMQYNDSVPEMMSRPDYSMMAEYTLDLETGGCSLRQVSNTVTGDFPVIAPSRCGRKSKYAYFAKHRSITDRKPYGTFAGIAKLDLMAPEGVNGAVGVVEYPAGWVGGEASFVPRFEDPSKCKSEDDGFLVVYITNLEAPHQSKFMVYDAATMSSTPLASADIPQTVPLGFHGTWVTASQLAAQTV